MGIIIRQSIKASIVTYLGMTIGMVNVIILSARFFSAGQIGLTRVLIENALLFVSLAQLGTPYIATKYFSYFRNEEKKHQGFLFFLLLFCTAGFAVFSLLYICSKGIFIHFYQKNSPELIDYYYYILPLVFFTMYFNVMEAYSQVNGRIVVPTMVREIFLKLSNSVLILLFAVNIISFDGFIYGLIISFGIALFWIIIYLQQMNWLHLKIDFSLLNRKFFREMLLYGLFIVVGGIGYILSTKIDVLMLPALINLQSTGVYVIAVFVAGVIDVPRRSISQIATPIVAQAMKDNDLAKVEELYKKSAINQLLAGSFLLLGIWCNIDAIFSIIPHSEIYRQGKFVVLFISLARLIDMASGINGEIILNSKYYRFSLTSTVILALLTIITNLIFIPLYGINGAAFATSLSVFIFTLIKLIFVWFKFRLQPYNFKTLMIIFVAIVSFGITLLIPEFSENIVGAMASIAIKSICIVIVFFTLTIKLKLSEEVNAVMQNIFQRLKLPK